MNKATPRRRDPSQKKRVNLTCDEGRTQTDIESQPAANFQLPVPPVRDRLPDTRDSITHKFSISGHEGYFTVGLYDDGRPGELFIKMAKQGSTMSGLMDTIGVLTSLALQYGVPVETLARKFEQMRFEPSGTTHNPEIRHATSVVDYVFRWVAITFSAEFRTEHESRAKNVKNQGEATNPSADAIQSALPV
jgi:ribonucleoside-diphosphate reductase alpha chain